jgi:hypothetical protein
MNKFKGEQQLPANTSNMTLEKEYLEKLNYNE